MIQFWTLLLLFNRGWFEAVFTKNTPGSLGVNQTAYGILASTIYNGTSKFDFWPPSKGVKHGWSLSDFSKKIRTFAYTYVLQCFYHKVPKIRVTTCSAMIESIHFWLRVDFEAPVYASFALVLWLLLYLIPLLAARCRHDCLWNGTVLQMNSIGGGSKEVLTLYLHCYVHLKITLMFFVLSNHVH
jgi:hypothetical protein